MSIYYFLKIKSNSFYLKPVKNGFFIRFYLIINQKLDKKLEHYK